MWLIIICFLFPGPTQDDPCYPSPCGSNTQCNNGICSCIAEYNGDPYQGCKPECVLNSDCPRNRACLQHKCVDPCPGSCGQGAICDVFNHIPMCSCPPNLEGNAFLHCRPIESMSLQIKLLCDYALIAFGSQLHPNWQVHVTQILVAETHNVEFKTQWLFALVSLVTLVHLQFADPSVFKTQTVSRSNRVSTRSASIRVLDIVV